MDRDFLKSIDQRLQRIEEELLEIREALGGLKAKVALISAAISSAIILGVKLWWS